MQPVPIARITLDDGALAVLPAVDHPTLTLTVETVFVDVPDPLRARIQALPPPR